MGRSQPSREMPGFDFSEAAIDAYKAISLQIRQIFAEYTPIIEPLSLDEAYLDVTENLKGINSAIQMCDGTGCLDQFPGERAKGGARAPSLRGRGAVCLLAWTQPAAHCASFPIGPPAGAPRSAVLAGKFSNRRPVVQINPAGFEHIACRFGSARCHRQPLPQAPEQSHSPSLVNLGAWAASGCVTVRCVAASSGARQSDVKRRSALPVRRQRA
jgi:impB/mucB/samB family